MTLPMRQICTAGTLAGYLLAVVAASSHHHGHDHGPLPSAVTADSRLCCHQGGHDHGAAGHCHEHAPVASPGSEHHHHHGELPQHHDDCVVCQFLALKTVSAPVVTLTGLVETMPLSESAPMIRPDAPSLSLPLSRGPPCTIQV